MLIVVIFGCFLVCWGFYQLKVVIFSCFLVCLVLMQEGLKGRGVNQLQGQKFNNKVSKCRLVVRANAKEIAYDQKSRAALQRGIDKLVNVIAVTIGPKGMFSSASFLSSRPTKVFLRKHEYWKF